MKERRKNELTASQKKALDIGASTVVTASAGSGKTRVLTERYIRILHERTATVSEIVAITFTEKAAAEMLGRVRTSVAAKIEAASAAEYGYWEDVFEELSNARISTIHAFCAGLLRENAIDTRVDPNFRILEGPARSELVSEVLGDYLTERGRKESDAALETALKLWDRETLHGLLNRMLTGRWAFKEWARFMVGVSDEDVLSEWRKLAFDKAADEVLRIAKESALEEKLSRLAAIPIAPLPPSDGAADLLSRLAVARREMGRPEGREEARALSLLGELFLTDGGARSFTRCGNGAHWKKAALDLAEFRECATAAAQVFAAIMPLCAQLETPADRESIRYLKSLSRLFLDFLEAYEKAKGYGQSLDFDDLLEKTSEMLSGSPAVLERIRSRAKYVLVDEFQDTNEEQWGIVRRMVSDRDGNIAPGRLFVVGDVKQSIYAFRGAQVEVLESVKDCLKKSGVEARLEENFRTLDKPLEFCNALFSTLWERDDIGRVEMSGVRKEGPGHVELLVSQEDAETSEADLVAGRIRELLDGARDAPQMPPVKAEDVAILLRTRTRLLQFEEALRHYGVPFTVLGGMGFYDRQEVLDCANLVRFLSDERREIPLAGVLRGPMFALADRTLMRIREQGCGLWDDLEKTAVSDDGGLDADERERVRMAWQHLARWRSLADRLPIPELLACAFEESAYWAASAAGERGPQRVANVEKFLEIACDFSAEGMKGLRHFAGRLDRLISESATEAEADIDLGSAKGVRVMTVHAAKGLEFPVVVVPDLSTRFRSLDLGLETVVIEGRAIMGIQAPDPAMGFAMGDTGLLRFVRQTAKRKNLSEMKRLFYVACTRARDVLILAGAEKGRRKSPEDASCWMDWIRYAVSPDGEVETLSEASKGILCAGSRKVAVPIVTETGAERHQPEARSDLCERILAGETAPADDFVKQAMALRQPLEDAGGTFAFSATAYMTYLKCKRKYWLRYVAGIPEVIGGPLFVEDEESEGREAGIERGRIVHAVLSLPQPDMESAVSGVIAAQGGGDAAMESDVRRHVRNFLESETGKRSLSSRTARREMPFVLKIGDLSAEGAMDLAWQEEGLWKILDYKTNQVHEDAAVDRVVREAKYDVQMKLYALVASRLLCADPAEVEATLFFTGPSIARTYRFATADLEPFAADLTRFAEEVRSWRRAPPARDDCRDCRYQQHGICRAI